MRCEALRAGICLTTALITAAVADLGTELAENLGFLGGSVRDAQQEAVLPTLLVGLLFGALLAFCVAFARVPLEDPLLHCMRGSRERATDFAFALAGSALCTVAMEGYETRFGGFSPFDPRSVVCSHAAALLVTFVFVAPIVRGIVSAALRLAIDVGERATSAVVRFLCKICRDRALPALRILAFALHSLRIHATFADGACGLRAPPLISFGYFVT
jgi:hypothetical protein